MKTSPRVLITFRAVAFGVTVLFQIFCSVGSGLRAATTSSDQPIYQLSEVQKPPIPKREPRIRFSREQRKRNDEITLRFVVTAKGETTQLTIVKFSNPEMVALAFRVYESVEYIPAVKDGKPVDTWMEVTETAK